MNTQLIIDYLSSLSANNNREWYHANKETYKKANAEFESFLQALIPEIGKFDSSVLHNSPPIIPRSVPISPQKGSCRFLSAIIL